jgi:probable HAF family extracellular repeat protein
VSLCKSSGLGIFAAVCLLGETTGLAHAQCAPSSSTTCATEWSSGSGVNLGGLQGFTESAANSINNAGQIVGYSDAEPEGITFATEWSGGKVTDLGGLPGSPFSRANSINDAGRAVGSSQVGDFNHAVEWSGGTVISLGGLPGFTSSEALSINDAGQIVGDSNVDGSSTVYATEWRHGRIIDLGGPGSVAISINDAGQVVGESTVGGVGYATEWSGRRLINLGGLPSFTGSFAGSINAAGQIVGTSDFFPLSPSIPESSTWAMMLLGFAGLVFAGYRGSERGVLRIPLRRGFRKCATSLCGP